MDWYLKALRQWTDFSTRARRKEYWMFTLFYVLIAIGVAIVETILGLGFFGVGLLSSLFGLAMIIPGLAVSVRRLHDTGRSGLWLLIGFVPFIGWAVLLYFMVIEGTRGANQYGPDPKGMGGDAAPSTAPPAMNARPM